MTNSRTNFTKLKPKIQLDFLGVGIKTASRTNLKTIQPKLERILGYRPSVDVLDETAGRSASLFVIKVQNPKNISQIQRIIGDLKCRFDLAEEPIFSILEIAFDLKRRTGTTDNELAEAVAHLYKFSSFHPHRENHRIYRRGKGAEEVPARMANLVRHVAEGCCIGVGSQRRHSGKRTTGKADPISARYYLKRTDDRQALAEAAYSARAERTFQGAAMPFRTLAELELFDFNTLKDLFEFRKLKDELNPLTATALRDYALPIFDTRTRSRREGGTRENHPATLADSALNEIVRRAFRSFVRSWNESTACGNSVKFEDKNPVTIEAEEASAITYSNNNSTDNKDNNNEDSIKDFFNYPDNEEDIRIAKLFEYVDCESSTNEAPEDEEKTPPIHAFYFNRPPLYRKDESNQSFWKEAGTDRLQNWKLFEIFAAQAP